MASRKTGIVCAVRGCHNNWYKRKIYLEQECFVHQTLKRVECGCEAPYELYPPPKNEESLRLWLKALNLKKPPKRPYVCSFHFVHTRPTEDHPIPEKWLGYEVPIKNPRRHVKRLAETGQPSHESLERDPDWAPSLPLGHSEVQSTDSAKRDKQRQQKTSKLQMSEIAQIIKDLKTKEEAIRTEASNASISVVKNVCCVVNCDSASHDAQGNRLRNGPSFYCFPSWRRSEGVFVSEITKRRREAWVTAVARTDITSDNVPNAARVCSRHFVSGKPAYEMLETNPDWAPSLNLNDNKIMKARQKMSKSHPTEDPQMHTGGATEKPDVLLWKDLKSRLQSLMEDKLTRAQPAEDMGTTELDFKDFFRNTLEVSLEACISSRPQRTTETRPTLDLDWFSPHKAFVYKKPTSFSAPASTVDCENCVRLKECIVELEKRRMEGPIEQNQDQTDSNYSEWMEPLSQTELDEEEATVDDHTSSSSSRTSNRKTASFQLSWLKKYWFLRYSPKLNVMWCHVCEMYAGKAHRNIAFVVGSKTFYQSKIIQHSNTDIHKQSVKRFKSDENFLQE